MSANIIPALRYRDAPKMIDWLELAFGFKRHAVHEDGQGGIAHAQLVLDGGMIMLSTRRDDEFGQWQKTPAEAGFTTQSPYIIVPDADAVYERAKAAGAEVLMPIADQDYGGRVFCCRDPEGHVWSFGTYDPWKTV